jgi:septal ring factor EnvC (AmiA/AmiB activator)
MTKITISLIFITYCISLFGQSPNSEKCDYSTLFTQGKQAEKTNLLDKALLYYNSARRCDPSKGKEIDEAINGVLKGIQKQKKTAEIEKQKAKVEQKKAEKEKNRAEAQTEIAFEEKRKVEKQARAAHNTAVFTARAGC